MSQLVLRVSVIDYALREVPDPKWIIITVKDQT